MPLQASQLMVCLNRRCQRQALLCSSRQSTQASRLRSSQLRQAEESRRFSDRARISQLYHLISTFAFDQQNGVIVLHSWKQKLYSRVRIFARLSTSEP